MKNPIVHFEIPADDVSRAKKFYEKSFGWQITKFPMKEGDYWIVRTSDVDKKMMPVKPGRINGGMMERKNKGQPFMNYICVDSLDKAMKDVVKNGGKICMPKQDIGENVGCIAAFQDTEGNLMGLVEPPEHMKEK